MLVELCRYILLSLHFLPPQNKWLGWHYMKSLKQMIYCFLILSLRLSTASIVFLINREWVSGLQTSNLFIISIDSWNFLHHINWLHHEDFDISLMLKRMPPFMLWTIAFLWLIKLFVQFCRYGICQNWSILHFWDTITLERSITPAKHLVWNIC